MAQQISIVMADDHPIVRSGLRVWIEKSGDFVVLGEACDGQQALEMIQEHRPALAVLDVDMPKLDGFDVARAVKQQRLPCNIIFLTLHTDEDIFHTAIEVGGKGYVLKDSATQEIVASLRAVAAGQMYVSPAMTSLLLQSRGTKSNASDTEDAGVLAVLTPTERRIVQLIGRGKSSKEIGDQISIHYRTVENHRTNICRKLGLEGAHALVRFTLQHAGEL